MRRVVPHEEPTVEDLEGPEDGGGVLSLANFSPDLNNYGVVDAWEGKLIALSQPHAPRTSSLAPLAGVLATSFALIEVSPCACL